MVNNIEKTFRPAYRIDHKPPRVVCVWCLLISGLFYLIAAVNTAIAATYYLDAVNGDDSNPGTEALPWKTLARAYDWDANDPNVEEGDTVYFKDGSYGDFLEKAVNEQTITRRNNWITYVAAPGHSPNINRITIEQSDNWGGASNGSSYLIFDGFVISDGVTIKGTEYVKILNCTVSRQGEPYEGYYAPYYDFAVVVASKDANYITIQDCNIFNGTHGIYAMTSQSGITWDGWLIKDNTIHRLSSDGINMSPLSNVIVEGNIVYDIVDVRQVVPVYGDKTGDFIVGEAVIQADTGAEGIVKEWFLGGPYLAIYQTNQIYFETQEDGGGTITGQDSEAILETINKTDPAHRDGIQLHSGSSSNIIIRGNIINTGGVGRAMKLNAGVSVTTNLTVENNLVYNAGSGGINIVGIDKVNIYNNTILGLPDKALWLKVGAAEQSCIVTNMYNNIIGGTGLGIQDGAGDGYVKVINHGNNIFDNNPNGFGDLYPFIVNGTELVDQDGYWQDYFVNWKEWGPGVDYNDADFHLLTNSNAIDFGNANYAPTTDIEGNLRGAAPDAGCYESNTSDPNNPSPELQAIGDKFVDENVALAFTVNATDPNGEPITYSAQSLPTGATLEPQTGDFAWTPSYTQAGIYQVAFRASDGNSWDSETITITVNNVNRPPVIGSITDQSVNENDLLSISANATDPDGQALTYSVSGLPAGAVFGSQTLTWTPSYDQAGSYPVTFTADDGQAQDSEAITITVINVNRTPVLAAINNQSVWADDPLTFTVDATDPDGDPVTYSAGNLPSDATFTGQDFDWTPSQGQMGSYDVTFIASDGQLQDSQMVTITVDVDSLAPTVTNSLPTAGSIQAPLNNLINLNITDAGKGIEADSVTIKVNNNTVYAGDTNHYSSPDGECRRLGNKADYRFVYQSNEEFDYDQTVSITVNATDLAGNVMSENSYSFVTEMRSFGQNMMVNSGSVNLNSGRPVTVRDSSGNIWAAWHAGPIDNRDIYIGKLAAGEENFGGTVQLADNTTDQCNPAVALDSSDKLYVVWQDNREGDWDIYVSTSVDGISWTTETRVNDPNDGDQVNPAIVIDGQSPNQAYVVWQDDRAGSQDICVATSSDGFGTTTVSQITSDISDQVEPAIAADSDNTIYIVWTDGRNGSNDIYGAASNNGLWNNVPVVTEDDGQSSPAIATEAVGSILHLVWVDDRLGDDDIYYDKTVAGLSPLTGRSIIDDTTSADQISPVIITTGYTGNDLKVFVCWRDERNADADLYFVEIGSDNETNVFVGDDGTSTDQSEPAIGIDGDDYPYLVWTNERTDIYYAGSTFVEPVALASTNVSVSSTATVGTVWNAVNSLDDVSAEVPQGAYLCDVKITISKIKNPPKSNLELDLFSGTYEFGPSGMEFIEPVTITIPYEVNGSENVLYTAYWYNPLTNTLSQQGITDVETIVISSTLHAVRFKTTHFSAFILGGGVAAALGGGGGGCSVSAGSEGNIVEFALPYIGLAVVMVILKMRDARYRKARST